MKITYTPIDGLDHMLTHFSQFEHDSKTLARAWAFRGQKVAKDVDGFYKLRTSLEKALTSCGHSLEQAPDVEMGLFRKFKRQSQQFLEHVPEQGNYMEWFALMQHHGAPTRLLDWTYSFFVALYFAVAELENDQEGELWAIDVKYLNERIKQVFPEEADRKCMDDDPNAQVYDNFERMFMARGLKQFVCSMNPYKFNTRLIIQQGLFLCPGDITKPFADNLAAHFPSERDLDRHLMVFKIEKKARNEIMQVLFRMNIGDASLFPGLDGFAKSLKDLLVFPKFTEMFPADSSYVKDSVWAPRVR
jgi:hypothetical protein